MPKISLGTDEIYYEAYDSGVPVVFIAGLCSDNTLWHWQREYFSKEYECIFFDNRGIGESTLDKEYFKTMNLLWNCLLMMWPD